MLYKIKYTLIVLLTLYITSCNIYNEDKLLDEALELSGVNRFELEKVLDYYHDDSLKYEAAKYLIRNMPGHYSYADTSLIVKYSNCVDSILTCMKDSGQSRIRESIDSCARKINIPHQKTVLDIKTIKAEYIIKNIEESFASWKEAQWAQHLSFDEFCEFILPYKIKELQFLDDWRSRLSRFETDKLHEIEWCDVYKNSTLAAARMLSQKYNSIMRPNYNGAISYPNMKWEVNIKVPFGTCDYYAPITMALFRSNGIPVCHDFTPHWACRRLGHSWNVLIAENGHRYSFNGIISLPGDGHNIAEKMAKVYRHTYSINEELLDLNKNETTVPALFKTFFIKDVTSEYLSGIDITIKPDNLPKDRNYVYLAIYGDQNWCPIAYGKVVNGKVKYKCLGRNTLYLPFYYDNNGKMTSISSPFIVQPNGKRKDVVLKNHITKVNLKRKYPTLEYVYYWLNRLDSCEFQASNDSTFKQYYIFHRINDCHATGHVVNVSDSVPACRYWRFYSTKPETHANIAEMYFYDKEGKRVKGKPIGTEGSWGNRLECTKEAAMDGDILSFFDAPDGDGSWVGVDFGSPIKLDHLFYYARGDGNAIEIDDMYELLYWDTNCWKSLGKKRGTSPTLKYNNVPKGAVLLLKNISKGKEERIFTYENGKQIWW